ncbi:hypothetical protein FA13DRAFT_1741161 [Coprinellus micaceus]|uniref:MYND-type domain-containing protein n=1 Tax=Coprinellus micaceus TaxID=71717 RepID=A0A4Y7SJY3_COPMI|nr:hypothetical protein FA13DRAFT_1741161 [Coprinellus micaceus]
MPDPRSGQLVVLLREAYGGSPSALRALLAFLVTNDNAKPVAALLDKLDPSKIPPASQIGEPLTHEAENAIIAIRSITSIFQSLGLEPKHPRVVQLRLHYGGLVLERWSTVMRWLVYYMLQAPYYSNPAGSIHFCTEVLMHITVNEEKDVWQEELLYLPSTTDFIYLLLCQVDPRNKSYHYIPMSSRGCSIMWMLWEYINDYSAFSNALARLKAVTPRTRDKIISSLVLRARHIAEIANGKREGLNASSKEDDKLLLAGRSLYLLMFCTSQLLIDPALWKVFLKHDFLFEYASALSILSTKAHDYEMELRRVAEEISGEDPPAKVKIPGLGEGFWKLMADTIAWFVKTLVMKRTPKPSSSIPSAIRGGIMHTALRCLLHLHPEAEVVNRLIDDAVTCTLSFVTTRKGYLALTKGYQDSSPSPTVEDELDDLLGRARRHSKAGKQVCKEIRECVERGERAFERYPTAALKLMLRMCGNRKHPLRLPGGAANTPYRVCARCHNVAYCSERCQREDWTTFHSKECSSFEKWYTSRQEDGQWTYFDIRRDCVLYLENLADWDLWPLVDHGVTRSQKQFTDPRLFRPRPGQIYRPDSKISVFDFASFEGLALKSKYSLNAYYNACWKYINPEWDARVRRICRDVEESNGWSCLVEGIFLHNETLCLFVLVRLGWDGDARDERRYKVEETVWRLGPRSVTEYIWDGFEEDK